MAIAYLRISFISRGKGQSVLVAAAYRHRTMMHFEREGATVDFSLKDGLIHEEFLLPADSPQWARAMARGPAAGASESFWNFVETSEKQANAQLAREAIIALPTQLLPSQNISLAREFIETHVLSRGMVADWVYHEEPGNPHIHLLMSLRPLADDGFGAKTIIINDENGAPKRRANGQLVRTQWSGNKADFLLFRNGWFECQNRHLALAGFDLHIDGRSYSEQNLDILGMIHVGPAASGIEREIRETGKFVPVRRAELNQHRKDENLRRIIRRPSIVLDIVTSERSVFERKDLENIIRRYSNDSALCSRLSAEILKSPEVLTIDRVPFELNRKKQVPEKFTTKRLIRMEARMAMHSIRLSKLKSHPVQANRMDEICDRHSWLNKEQRTAIRYLVDAQSIAVVAGRAGTGKTSTLKVAAEIWKDAGYTVLGGALAGKAAEGLQNGAHIQSRTLASWQYRWNVGKDRIDSRTVFIIDEAGLVASRQMAAFLQAVKDAGAKIVLVGDAEQLQPIEAGAAFRGIADKVGYVELETIIRQRDDWMREASAHLATNKTKLALEEYDFHGKIHSCRDKDEALTRLIANWDEAKSKGANSLILAHLRRDVQKLNLLARQKLIDRELIGREFSFESINGSRKIGKGDQLIFLRNDSSMGVKNGTVGEVVSAARNAVVVRIAEGGKHREVNVNSENYNEIDYGYATTIHKSQGVTADRISLLASSTLDRNLTYVAMTRHREDLNIYYSKKSFKNNEELGAVLSRNNMKEITLDYDNGPIYVQALRFAQNRGLNLLSVARTLYHDRLVWISDQAKRLREMGSRLQKIARSLPEHPREAAVICGALVPGVSEYTKSVSQVVSAQLAGHRALQRDIEMINSSLRKIFKDPECVFEKLEVSSLSIEEGSGRAKLDLLRDNPGVLGNLHGQAGLFARRRARQEREAVLDAAGYLATQIGLHLDYREKLRASLEREEVERRQRMSVAIPYPSETARNYLVNAGKLDDEQYAQRHEAYLALDQGVKAELEAFATAIDRRFGKGAFWGARDRDSIKQKLVKVMAHCKEEQRQYVINAWNLLRAAQKIESDKQRVNIVEMYSIKKSMSLSIQRN
ncbi:Ti-type conjugative transfer relaxase TraA [Ochrobactrum intermedium]|uniref:Ti-type conjugative transfer relaxase TraA n=1 Tax=Brucella intermedia TaxID=94625 RepID=UPI00159C6A24|nr:Ti-type conjugative transfer relaxase TraA [Brucella intermedia]NVM40557.1 Ti-type conjugative transfer relaxase TraA [Brucella intermedia]